MCNTNNYIQWRSQLVYSNTFTQNNIHTYIHVEVNKVHVHEHTLTCTYTRTCTIMHDVYLHVCI